MVLSVTPCQVAPPFEPPAHWPMHGGGSSRPGTENGFPVVAPVAALDTPTCRAVVPLPAGTEPPETDPPGTPPPFVPAGGAPPLGSAGLPGCWPTGAEDAAGPGVPDPNWPPRALLGVALLDGATMTRMI